MEELLKIQTKLKVPKSQYNTFGKYNYRSTSDILEAVKPILNDTGCNILISDEIVQVGDRYYIKAIVTLTNSSGESVTTTAFAREAENKTGMDASQITGTASSYARKYALNGLLCIDDTKDEDTNEMREERLARGKVASQAAEKSLHKKPLLAEHMEDATKCDQLMQAIYKAHQKSDDASMFDPVLFVSQSRELTSDVRAKLKEKYDNYYQARTK